MKKFNYYSRAIIILSAGIMLTSCIKFEKDTEADIEAIDTAAIPAAQIPAEKEEITEAVYIYNDVTGIPERNTTTDIGNAAPEELVAAINKYNGKGQVVLEYVKTSSDTVYVRIPDSMYLTQQMGTLGPHAYMATATYTLTDAKGIKYVTFDFEEGDHAAPGTYERGSFKPQPLN